MLVITEKNLVDFVSKLKERFEVFDVRKDPPAGGLPPKKYFFPPIQETFVKIKDKIKASSGPRKEFVLFGFHLSDLEAITQLDEIMSKPHKDYFYFQNRSKAVIIGLINEEIDAPPGGDIIFQKVRVLGSSVDEKLYRVFTNTKIGSTLVSKNKDFFEEIDEATRKIESEKIQQTDWSASMRRLLLDSELLAKAVEWSHDHKIWDDLAEKCLGCGICTYVCPLCHCFSTEDSVGLDDKCTRCRKWDACTLPNFAKIAGGHSFRPTLKERYYNWFYHKFVRSYSEFGKSQCVGCGRCKKNCPAGIDIQEILRIILEDYKKSQS